MDNEDLVLTLEALVEKFEDDMAPYALGLAQHLAAAFWRATAAEAWPPPPSLRSDFPPFSRPWPAAADRDATECAPEQRSCVLSAGKQLVGKTQPVA